MTKTCSRCRRRKPAVEFHRNRKKKDGRASHCRSCHRRDYYDLDAWRARRFKRSYGITLEEYDLYFKKQGGLCALCRGESNGRGRLAVDHDHETGEVRGLLCFTCNTNLAWVERVSESAVANYLSKGVLL